MSFYGISFVFDNIPSETYGLYLFDLNGNGVVDTDGGNNIEIIQEKIFRRPVPFVYGIEQASVLEFELTFGSFEPLDRLTITAIQRWLFGSTKFKKLQIMQEDMNTIYYDCVLTDAKVTEIGNLPYSFKCKVICNAPWAWSEEVILTYPTTTAKQRLLINNISDNNDYTYPILEFTVGASKKISIINKSDNNREFLFTNVPSGERLVVDNDLQIISSSSSLRRLTNFNLKFFRLVQGLNVLEIDGLVTNLKIKYKPAKKVGG